MFKDFEGTVSLPECRFLIRADEITFVGTGKTGPVSIQIGARRSKQGVKPQKIEHLQKEKRMDVVVAAQDPDSIDNPADAAANQGPPTLFWRVFAALCYLVPWIDSISLGREIYRRFRNLLVLYLVPGPLAKVYFSSQFAPLIIFFVMFLSIVKNKKLHHFVRFNCMQVRIND